MGKYYGPGLFIYENKKVLPRFYVLNNGQVQENQVKILKYSPDRIELIAQAQDDSKLIATINYYPFWEAHVNGIAKTLSVEKSTFISLNLDKGINRIILKYNPPYKLF